MGRRFVEDTLAVNIRAFDLQPGTYSVRVGSGYVSIAWERYLFGMRPWFICQVCGRHCKLLYESEDCWSCRLCQKLVYRSQWTSKWYQFVRGEQRLLELVKNGKPKWKHKNKYNELLIKLEAVQTILNAAMAARLLGMKQLTLRKATKQVIDQIKRR